MNDEEALSKAFPIARGVGVPVRPQPIGNLGIGSGKRDAATRKELHDLVDSLGIRAIAEVLKESDDARERLQATEMLLKYTIGAKKVVEVRNDDAIRAMFVIAARYVPESSWNAYVEEVASAFGMETDAEHAITAEFVEYEEE